MHSALCPSALVHLLHAMIFLTFFVVCRVALRRKGKNIPCLRDEESYFAYFGEAENVTCAANETTPKCLRIQQDHGIYNMGKVPNIGNLAHLCNVSVTQDHGIYSMGKVPNIGNLAHLCNVSVTQDHGIYNMGKVPNIGNLAHLCNVSVTQDHGICSMGKVSNIGNLAHLFHLVYRTECLLHPLQSNL